MIEFSKNFNPNEREQFWYKIWQENQIYKADNQSEKPAYSILMPPPNVTGILHFGHVLNHTLQDIYIRYKRMNGYEVCWFPGLDHAGIATQARVEKELKKNENLTRYDLGRDKFVEKVKEWKEEYGNIILDQLAQLGISADWSRTLYTLDEGASNAVQEVFVRLFDEGLIYRGKRIINWSPLAQTALSDEEVEFREVKEYLYTLRYYFEDKTITLDNGENYLKVATVRPETIYGDIAVAVNPNDERYKHLIGEKVIVPMVNRAVPIIADDYADPTFGTGCVKITPAHDPNDFELGLRHNLEQINTINPDGTLNELTGKFNGLDRFDARKAFMSDLQSLDLVEKIEDYTHNVGFSQRGGEPIEPYLSDQWFVNMKALTTDALEVVKRGEIKFHPNHWVKTYENWLTNIKDWCISRQLWWGHRIPVYYAEDGSFTAANNIDEARLKLGLDSNAILRQDEDVLDTWFSSWLWPMTTMGWLADGKTEETTEQSKFLPTDLLVTAPDIIFFWVARMIMATYKYKKVIPFKNVYFTSLVRDGQGRKLSKSLGNSPDPLNIINKYGADATRFTMIYLAPLGLDVRMDINTETQDIPSMEIGRNFQNKVWNAGRFLQMKLNQVKEEENNSATDLDFTSINSWIESSLNNCIQRVNSSLDAYNVSDYSKALHEFIWRDFCDWYVELVKIYSQQDTSKISKIKVLEFSISIYKDILKLLHPTMPFITEELWHLLFEENPNKSISTEQFPTYNEQSTSILIQQQFDMFKLLVDELRTLKAKSKIANQKSEVIIKSNDNELNSFLINNALYFNGLTKSTEVKFNTDIIGNKVTTVIQGIEIIIPIPENAIDIESEKSRIESELNRLQKQVDGINAKLSNQGFVAKAPQNVIDTEKKKLNDMQNSISVLKTNLANLE
jgi:valyl-tRNA synthetase